MTTPIKNPRRQAEEWHLRARCRHAATEQFLPFDGERGIPDRARHAARLYCATCPVIEHCDAAATARRDHGLWAGAWRDEDNSRHGYRIRNLL